MSTAQPPDPMIGRLVDGRYRVRARIARGGMATVYVATDLRLERRVALKVMHGHLTDDAVFQGRFIQEARAAARLANPHVVSVFDQGQDAGLAYLVMEYLPGITLRELLRDQRRLTVPQAVTIMDAVLTGLAAAHRAGIVHRDVKPENILLAEDGRIKIGDFGLARATTANTATGQQLLGTIAYLAPELVTRGTADARSDIYALGIMLYEMLAGEQPYKGEQPMQIAFQHATDSVPRPSVKNPGVPEPLDDLVLWATAKSPDERPSDAQEMLDRLREIERELGVTPMVTTAVTSGVPLVDEHAGSGDLTKVLPAALTGPTATVENVDNAGRLRRVATRRRTKGAWLVVIAILAAALTGGAGWWFGSGPGSLVQVPDVAGETFESATAILAKNSLVAVAGKTYDLHVEKGKAVGTDPDTGERLDKGTKVTVFISEGRRPQTIESLSGRTESEVQGLVESKGLHIGDRSELFTTADAGVVVGATLIPRDAGDPKDCTKGCDALEDDTVALTVSVGPVPSVAGLGVQQATEALTAKNLNVSGDSRQVFDDKVEKDKVIGIQPRDGGGSWRPGETVTLIVSKGPKPIPVPDVIGMTVRDAIDAINGSGLSGHADLPEVLWGIYHVTGVMPGQDTEQLPGTTISITGFSL